MTLTFKPLAPAPKPKDVHNIREITSASGQLFGTDVYGGVAQLDATDQWVTAAADPAATSYGVQLAFEGWGGVLHAVTSDGTVLRFGDGKWAVVAPAGAVYKAKWPLCAFDPVRGVLVVWGSQKKGGRRDDCTVFNGSEWSKPKKGAATSKADLEADGSGAFCLFYDARIGKVVRVGTTEAAYFDGTWKTVPLTGDAINTWERLICVDSKTQRVFSVQRFTNAKDVVELVCSESGVVATKVGEFDAAVKRAPSDSGGNVAFDYAGYDAVKQRLLVFDEKTHAAWSLDLVGSAK